MPGGLDSCINNVFEDGNIPASSGTTPVRVVLPGTFNRIVLEAAAAAAVQDWSVITAADIVEAATATDTQDGTVSGAPAVPWTPAELGADIVAWYDAMDAADFSLSGSTVTQWNDVSGNSHHLTSVSTRQPTRETVADFGGANAVKYDGSNDYLSTSIFSEANPVTLCMIYRTASTIDDLECLFDGRTGAGAAITTTVKWSGASNKPHCYGGNAVARTNTVLSISTTYIDIVDTTGGAGKTYLNGAAPDPSSFNQGSPTNAVQIIFLGGMTGGGLATFGGHIAEFVLVGRVLTTLERQKMEGYLAYRWGRQANLDGSHPYKTDPPYV